MDKKQIRLLLVEDHEVMRSALRSLLDTQPDFTVVGEAGTGREMLESIRQTAPDLVVMDINLPELNGIEATRQLNARFPQIKILGLSVHTSGRMVSEMLSAGAAGYVPKSSAAPELVAAIRTVMAGKMYVSPEVLGDLVRARSRAAQGESAFEKLTEREREVLQLLAEGLSTKEIAHKLGLSVPTIHTHRQHLMQKIETQSLADLVRYAIREGIVTPDE